MSGLSERNPYVGPRAIQRGEPLYGRTSEVEALYDHLLARRIVVLHSPSGAGKSSLIQAGLIPKLEQAGFDVWKPIRVNLDPAELEGVAPGTNRYLLSALVSLEEELPPERRRSPAELAGLDLIEYLEARPRRKRHASKSVVLLFDQFEEVLTLAPLAIADKRAFFSAVGRALDTANYWALFAIREDYLGAFAPYRDRVPTELGNTFRLDFLSVAGAREAAEQPALAGGRTFPAVDLLVRDLSKVHIQQSDGSFSTEQGVYVEPVQLQVVCRRLWDAMPDDATSIEREHIERYGDVSESLGGYYAQAVAKIAAGDPSVEREIREWVGGKLIVDGIRSQVRREVEDSAGLANVWIEGLLSVYLVRSEQRAGASWFELSHDRLVAPVQRDNEAWDREHLHPLQVQARLWEQGHRDPSLLLSDEALVDAAAWAASNPELVIESEQQFLAASEQRRAKQRARRRRQAGLTVIAVVVAVVMAALVKWARTKQHQAEAAELVAAERADALQEKVRELNAQTAKTMALTPGAQRRGLIKALEAVGSADAPRELSQTLEAGLFAATRSLHDVYELPGHRENIVGVAWSPDGRLLASASRDDLALVWGGAAPHERGAVLKAHTADVTHLEFSASGDRILTLGDDGKVFTWSVDTLTLDKALALDCSVRSARLSPDGRTAALACRGDNKVGLWTLADDEPQWLDFDREVGAIEFTPAGTHLVAVQARVELGLANLESLAVASLGRHARPITGIAVSPDGGAIASSDEAGVVKLWASPTGDPLGTLEDDQGEIARVVFSPDRAHLAVVGVTMTPTIWQLEGKLSRTRLVGHTAQVADAAFSPDGALLVTVGYDQTARLWDADTGHPRDTLESPNALLRVAFSPTGTLFATSDSTGSSAPMVRVWSVESSTRRVRVREPPTIEAVALSADGGRVAMARSDRVRVFDTQTGELVRELEAEDPRRLQISPSGRTLAVRSPARWEIWDVEAGTRTLEIPGYVIAVVFTSGEEPVTADLADRVGPWSAMAELGPPTSRQPNPYASLALSSTGMLAGARLKGRVSVWAAAGADELFDVEELSNYLIDTVAFSPSGRFLAITTKQKMVWLVDVERGETRSLRVENPIVGAAAFSPDERYLLVGNGDAVTLLSLESDAIEVIATIGHHGGPVEAAAFSSDGRWALTSSTDGAAIAWPTTSEDRRALACELVHHSPVAYRDALESCRGRDPR